MALLADPSLATLAPARIPDRQPASSMQSVFPMQALSGVVVNIQPYKMLHSLPSWGQLQHEIGGAEIGSEGRVRYMSGGIKAMQRKEQLQRDHDSVMDSLAKGTGLPRDTVENEFLKLTHLSDYATWIHDVALEVAGLEAPGQLLDVIADLRETRRYQRRYIKDKETNIPRLVEHRIVQALWKVIHLQREITAIPMYQNELETRPPPLIKQSIQRINRLVRSWGGPGTLLKEDELINDLKAVIALAMMNDQDNLVNKRDFWPRVIQMTIVKTLQLKKMPEPMAEDVWILQDFLATYPGEAHKEFMADVLRLAPDMLTGLQAFFKSLKENSVPTPDKKLALRKSLKHEIERQAILDALQRNQMRQQEPRKKKSINVLKDVIPMIGFVLLVRAGMHWLAPGSQDVTATAALFLPPRMLKAAA
jgi:hypothetical protein